MLYTVIEELEGDTFPSSYNSGFYSNRDRESKSNNKVSSNNNNNKEAIED